LKFQLVALDYWKTPEAQQQSVGQCIQEKIQTGQLSLRSIVVGAAGKVEKRINKTKDTHLSS